MTELKCPFCQQELKELYSNGISVGFRCKNKNCPETNIMCGTKMLWQTLIDTKKKFDRAIWWLNEIVENHRFTPISTAEKALAEIKDNDKDAK